MPAPRALDGAVVLRLELVVELLRDPLAQLGGGRLDVEAGRQSLDEREEHLQVAQVGLDRLGDARVLDLDRHAAPSRVTARWTWPIEAAAKASRSKSSKCLAEGHPELLAQQLLHPLVRQRRHLVAQRGERLLELLALALGDRR